jgi:4'-phosphopantetheinyl transferase
MTDTCADRPGLASGEIHVWIARLSNDHHAISDSLRLLSGDERARAAQFAFEQDRVRFIQTKAIVRRILADYCGADGATLGFARNRHGKPYLIPQAASPNLQFSVSHSGDFCMLAVLRGHAVGVDVEKLRDLPQAMDIVQSYFTPAERRALAALPERAQREAFFVLWTHKEAIVKGLGVSLAAHLGRLEFERDRAGQLRLAAWDDDRSIARSWSTARLDPEPGYVGAIASNYPIRSLKLQNWNCFGVN